MMDLTVSPWLPEAAWDDWRIKRWWPDPRHTVLMHGDDWWMSDLPVDLQNEYELFAKAEGRVLVTGLGLGVVVAQLCRMPQVESVDVVEINQGLYEHVDKHLRSVCGNKLTMIQADATLRIQCLRSQYDWAWHDIWLKPTEEQIDVVELMYAPFVTNQLSWWPRPPRKC